MGSEKDVRDETGGEPYKENPQKNPP